MAYDINFALLGAPVNIGAAIDAGYQRGREMRMQGQQDSAFSMLARDPNSAEGRALLTQSSRPDLARQFRQWGREDQADQFRQRLLGGPAALGAPASAAPAAFPPAASIAPPGPTGAPPAAVPAFAAPTAPVAASVPPPMSAVAPAVGTPRQPDPQIMRQWFAADPAGAREFMTTWNGFNDAQREIATQRFTAAIPLLTQSLSVPYEQRRAFIQSHAQDLMTAGWAAEEIAGFDPTDNNTQLLIRKGLPIAQQGTFFAPIEGGPGQVYRNRFGLGVDAANPSPPRTQITYDEQGNQIIESIPGTPAIGPGANLFGANASAGQVQTGTAPGAIRPGAGGKTYRFRGGDDTNPANWEEVPPGTRPPVEAWADPVLDERGAAPGQQTFP